jgi:hypothetical protein
VNIAYAKEEEMEANLIALYTLTGFAVATWVMMHIWLPDPPPFNAGKYVGILVAGAVGAVVGGFLVSRGASNPMPGFVGAVAGAMFLGGSVGLAIGSGVKSGG